MKKVTIYQLILVASLLFLGCQKEEVAPEKDITDTIVFSMNSNAGNGMGYSASTKAAENMMTLVSEDGTDTLFLNLTDIADLDNTAEAADTATTKGTPVTGNNLAALCNNEIALHAFYQNEQFINDILVFENNGQAKTSTASYWPTAENALVDFWSFHPKGIAVSINNTTPSLSFNYNQISKEEGKTNELVDATEQKDLFFAYTRQGKTDGAVDLNYRHALAAVKFTAGKAHAGIIHNITITNVYAAGTVTFSPNEENNIHWVLNEQTSTLNQDFTTDIDENLEGDLSQAITLENTTFMLIPQSLTNKQLKIKYQRDGTDEAKEYTVNLPEGKWEAGKAYVYTLTLMDGLGINVETTQQQGIAITNAHNKPCYVRAMIIGNWVDEEGNIAGILNPDEINLTISTENTNYRLGANWHEYWYYDQDAKIYYYTKPLQKASETEVNLFETFTNPKPNSEGLKLDLSVMVQAVEAESTKASVIAAWGEEIANQLEAMGTN